MHCTALNCAALRCTALHCAALHYTVLHCLMRNLYKSLGFINIFFLGLRGLTKHVDLSDANFLQVPKFY